MGTELPQKSSEELSAATGARVTQSFLADPHVGLSVPIYSAHSELYSGGAELQLKVQTGAVNATEASLTRLDTPELQVKRRLCDKKNKISPMLLSYFAIST